MTDRRALEGLPEQALLARGRVIAVAAGALIALLAMLSHVPLRVATWRGAIAFAAVSVVVAATRRVLAITAQRKGAPQARSRERTNL